jgi:hypothetical protein
MAAVSPSTQQSSRKPTLSPSLSSLHETDAAAAAAAAPTATGSGTTTKQTTRSPTHHRHQHHLSTASTTSQRSGGLLALAAAALDKTFSGISEPRIRHRQSSNRLSVGPDSLLSAGVHPSASPDKQSRSRPASNYAAPASTLLGDGLSSSRDDPPSQPYSETDPNHPPPIRLSRLDNKMHQTSSRLLRMTDDDRPFTKVSRVPGGSALWS